jgi:hypothetical protein
MFFQPTLDLFRKPVIFYQQLYKDPSYVIYSIFRLSLLSVFCKCIGLFGMIAPTSSIPFKFSTNGRFMNANHFGNLRLCLSCFKQRIYSVSFFQRKLAVVVHLCSSFFTVGKVRSLKRLGFFHNQSLSCTY